MPLGHFCMVFGTFATLQKEATTLLKTAYEEATKGSLSGGVGGRSQALGACDGLRSRMP